jgi:hypothetical protein
MFNVHRMRLHLSADLLPRAETIARSISHELAGIRPYQNQNLESLKLPNIQIEHHFSDKQIARQVANAIESSLNNPGDK